MPQMERFTFEFLQIFIRCLNDSRRYAYRNGIVWYIPAYNCSCTNDHIVANFYAGQNNNVVADIDVIAYDNV